MIIKFYKTERTLIGRVSGELDLVSADKFRLLVDKELEDEDIKKFILNLKEVTFIDSSGLGAILGRYKKLIQKGGIMTIVEASPQVNRILELSGIMRIMKVYTSELEALA